MRICVISFHTSPLTPAGAGKSGGMNIFIDYLYRKLARSHTIDIFVNDKKNDVKLNDKLRVVYINQDKPERFADLIMDYHQRYHYDILHTHYWLSGIIGLLLKNQMQIPWLHSFHTIEKFKGLVANKERIDIEHDIMKSCDVIISPTEMEAHKLHIIAPQSNTIVIPHGVDTGHFKPQLNGHNTLLFVGRLDPIKGLDVLIDALRIVNTNTELIVVGGASKGKTICENIKSYACGLPVNYVDRVEHKKLLAYYHKAGIVVVPSYYESFGLVGLEAMASGRPVIAFNDTGISETIGNTAGIHVPRHEKNLAWAIGYLLKNKNVRYRLGKNGRKKSIIYDWSNIAQCYESLYEKIIKN